MRMSLRPVLAAALLLIVSGPAFAALSGNLIPNGDFESVDNLKTSGGNDSLNNYIPIHRSNIDTDWGRWLAMWGPPSQADDPNATAGFSTYNDPRDLAETGGDTRPTGDLGTFNRSVDPINPGSGNHVMENILFRSRTGLWIHAPANQVAGPISFSFSFFQDLLDNHPGSWFNVSLYGLNFDFPHDTAYLTDGTAGNFITPILYGNPQNLDGDILAYCSFGAFALTAPPPGHDYSDEFNIWRNVSTDNAGDDMWIAAPKNFMTANLTQTYDNYAVVIYSVAYSEGDPYFWLDEGKITESPSILFDDIDFRVSVAPSYIPGDFNGDGVITLSDINPFKLALTDTAAWQAAYPEVVLTDVDPNGDGVITLSDINPFKAILTGGAAAVVPEPATLSLLALGGLSLLRRR
ncbi:MAG: PEP-CTERM sorting domain-containing protein [Phycisphaeraceae bacterium]|nr:PEP-CTERM sorting domain-containing protein [Phycisphaeraceae bacterium]